MLTIRTLTVKNFLSVGNQAQAINFDNKNLVLVIGENMDLGGDDAGARNGTGKTTIINAISYVFFGDALTQIRKDNLVNKTNNKEMLVAVEFEKNGTKYKIERLIEQIIMVSIKGSRIATIPSLTGCSAFAAACAIGAEP